MHFFVLRVKSGGMDEVIFGWAKIASSRGREGEGEVRPELSAILLLRSRRYLQLISPGSSSHVHQCTLSPDSALQIRNTTCAEDDISPLPLHRRPTGVSPLNLCISASLHRSPRQLHIVDILADQR